MSSHNCIAFIGIAPAKNEAQAKKCVKAKIHSNKLNVYDFLDLSYSIVVRAAADLLAYCFFRPSCSENEAGSYVNTQRIELPNCHHQKIMTLTTAQIVFAFLDLEVLNSSMLRLITFVSKKSSASLINVKRGCDVWLRWPYDLTVVKLDWGREGLASDKSGKQI